MPLEGIEGPTDYINSLVRTNPESADPKSEGDNHIRGVKNTILNTFPNVDGPVLLNQDDLNSLTFIGEIRMFGGLAGSIPSGWLACEGQALNEAQYPALYAVLGETWGDGGGGAGAFNLPDLRGRVAAGANGGATLTSQDVGDTEGDSTHRLTAGELAPHNHPFLSGEAIGTQDVEQGNEFNRTVNNSSVTSVNTPNNQPHNNVQPTAIVLFVIRTGAAV